MTIIALERVLERIQSLPPLPSAVSKLYKLSGDPRTNAKDMAHVISLDQVLTARILSYANSAYYGLSRKVATVNHAIMIIGFDGMRNLALAFSVFGFAGKKKNAALRMEDFWRHALATASAARLLSIHMDIPNIEEMFVVGLMHDIGRIVLVEHFDKNFSEMMQRSDETGTPLQVLEQDYFGIDHAGIGKILCERWNLPPALTTAITEHHACLQPAPVNDLRSDGDGNVMAKTVALAENLTKIHGIGSSGSPHIDLTAFEFIKKYNIPPRQMKEIFKIFPDDIRSTEQFFGLPPSGSAPMKRGKAEPKLRVAVQFANENLARATDFTLISLGFTPMRLDESVSSNDIFLAVIGDHSLDAGMRSDIGGLGIPMFDYNAWAAGVPAITPNILNIVRFKQWLSSQLMPLIAVPEEDAPVEILPTPPPPSTNGSS